jgi:two-component system, NarL family, nitrate/nitrite response regulator NarL
MSAETRLDDRAASGEPPIRVLILGNHLLIRAGLRKVLEGADRACVVHEGDGGSDVPETVSRFRPDIVLVDLDACDPAQIASIGDALEERSSARLLALSSDCTPETHRSLASIGAMGCVTKDKPADTLVKAVEKVSQGQVWFDRSTQAEIVAGLRLADDADAPPEIGVEALTSREAEIVESVAKGLKNKQVARRLFISEVTVRHHLTSIYSKLGISNRQQLMLYAFQRGLVPSSGGPAG